jgi:hypothetical protein
VPQRLVPGRQAGGLAAQQLCQLVKQQRSSSSSSSSSRLGSWLLLAVLGCALGVPLVVQQQLRSDDHRTQRAPAQLLQQQQLPAHRPARAALAAGAQAAWPCAAAGGASGSISAGAGTRRGLVRSTWPCPCCCCCGGGRSTSSTAAVWCATTDGECQQLCSGCCCRWRWGWRCWRQRG